MVTARSFPFETGCSLHLIFIFLCTIEKRTKSFIFRSNCCKNQPHTLIPASLYTVNSPYEGNHCPSIVSAGIHEVVCSCLPSLRNHWRKWLRERQKLTLGVRFTKVSVLQSIKVNNKLGIYHLKSSARKSDRILSISIFQSTSGTLASSVVHPFFTYADDNLSSRNICIC